MGDAVAVAIGVLLATAVLTALLVWHRLRHRDNSPAAKYLRDVRGIKVDTYRQTKPRNNPQVGDAGGYVGGTGPPIG